MNSCYQLILNLELICIPSESISLTYSYFHIHFFIVLKFQFKIFLIKLKMRCYAKILLSIRMSLDLTFIETSFCFFVAFRYFPYQWNKEIAKSKKKMSFSWKICMQNPFRLKSIRCSNEKVLNSGGNFIGLEIGIYEADS